MKNFFEASMLTEGEMFINLDYVAAAKLCVDEFSEDDYIEVYMVGQQNPFTIDGCDWYSLVNSLVGKDIKH